MPYALSGKGKKMSQFRAERKKSKVGTIAIILTLVLLLGLLGSVAAHVIANNYNPVTLNGKKKTVVGFVGLTNSNGVLTYTGDYAQYNEAQSEEETLYTLHITDTVEYVEMSSPLDDEWPYSDIKTVKDSYNNSFTAFPKMYISYSYNRAGYLDGVNFANYKVDDTYFINDAYLKQDGSGEYSDYFYIGQYEASGSASKIYSVPSATPLVSVTRADMRQGARAYGSAKDYYNGYEQMDITMWDMYAFLVCLYLKTSNVQSVYAGPVDLTAPVTTGTTAPISSMNGWNTSTHAVKFLGVENPYGSVSEWIDGVNFNDGTIYYQSNPNNYSDTVDETSDVVVEMNRPATSGYVMLLQTGTSEKAQSVVFPAVVSTEGGYENDYYWYTAGARILLAGGCYADGINAGLWCFDGNYDSSKTGDGFGGRLCGRDLPSVAAVEG